MTEWKVTRAEHKQFHSDAKNVGKQSSYMYILNELCSVSQSNVCVSFDYFILHATHSVESQNLGEIFVSSNSLSPCEILCVCFHSVG